MINHLRGTSATLAEKVFIGAGKGTETTGEGERCQLRWRPNRRRGRGSDKGGWHLGCFLEIIMRLAVLLPIVFSLFATFSLAADPSSSAALPGYVTAAAIIHEMNLA